MQNLWMNSSDEKVQNLMSEIIWSKKCQIWWKELSDRKLQNFMKEIIWSNCSIWRMKLSDKKLQNLMNEIIWWNCSKATTRALPRTSWGRAEDLSSSQVGIIIMMMRIIMMRIMRIVRIMMMFNEVKKIWGGSENSN